MGKIFNLDNPVMVFLSKTFDILFLSLIWVFFSTPIITMGASTTALYYTSVKCIRRDRGYVLREFWECFRKNFLQSTILWVITVVLVGLMISNVYFANSIGGTAGNALIGIYLMMSILLLGIGIYLLPFLSRFNLKIFSLIKTCLLAAFKHLPSTLFMIVLFLAIVALMIWIPIFFLILPALGSIGISMFMERILKKYTPKPEIEYDESGEEIKKEVPWYLE